MYRLKAFILLALLSLLAGCNSQIPTLRELGGPGDWATR